MNIRDVVVEEQIQQVLLYVQEKSADMWKENLLEDLKLEEVKFRLAEEFLLELRKEFGEEDGESVKVAKLRRIEQGGKIMEKFVQEF